MIEEMEIKRTEKKITKYKVEPIEREDGTIRVLVSQRGGWASRETREFKITATEQLILKHDINVCLLMELNFN